LHSGSPGPNFEFNKIDSIEMVIDHTWENNIYPWFPGNFLDYNPGDLSYDMEPFLYFLDFNVLNISLGNLVSFDYSPTPLTTFGNIYKFVDWNLSFSTLNFFPFSGNFPSYSGVNGEPNNGYQSGDDPYSFYHPSPNSLLFYDGNWELANSIGVGVPHGYAIEDPFDISIINSKEKTFYNPSALDINLNNNETLIFPSGYTLKTAIEANSNQNIYPTSQEVATAKIFFNSLGVEFKNDFDIPFDARRTSNYYLNSGILQIEDCVTLLDANINMSGGYLSYNSDNFIVRGSIPPHNGTTVIDRVQTMTCAQRTNIPCAYMFEEDYEITNSENWTDRKRSFYKNLIIKSGATLTLDNTTLRYSNSDVTGFPSGIIIEKGAKLIVDNGSVLTSYLDCGYWDGVSVFGQHTQPQSFSIQGSIEVLAGSKISNAKTGILTFDNTARGGIIRAYNAQFENNLLDIKLGWYDFEESASYVFYSSFTSQGSLGRFGETKTGFIISDRHWKPYISANSFAGEGNETAVENLGGEIVVYNNVFSDVLLAARAVPNLGSNPKSNISKNTININHLDGDGIYSDFGQTDQISENTIIINNPNPYDHIAIKQTNGSGGSVSYNVLNMAGGGSSTIGIKIENGTNIEYIKNNTLDGFKIGIELDGTGGNVYCSEFDNYEKGIFIASGNSWPDIGGINEPAGNNFNDVCLSGDFDVDFSGVISTQKYYWLNGNSNAPNAACVNPSIYLQKTNGSLDCESGSGAGDPQPIPDPPIE
jgi:hypothetical protein